MPAYVELEVTPGSTLLVEAPPSSENLLVDAGRAEDLSGKAVSTLAAALDSIRAAGASVISRMRNMEHRPDEITLEFAIQLAAEAGVVIASTSATANMRISFKWVEGDKDETGGGFHCSAAAGD